MKQEARFPYFPNTGNPCFFNIPLAWKSMITRTASILMVAASAGTFWGAEVLPPAKEQPMPIEGLETPSKAESIESEKELEKYFALQNRLIALWCPPESSGRIVGNEAHFSLHAWTRQSFSEIYTFYAKKFGIAMPYIRVGWGQHSGRISTPIGIAKSTVFIVEGASEEERTATFRQHLPDGTVVVVVVVNGKEKRTLSISAFKDEITSSRQE